MGKKEERLANQKQHREANKEKIKARAKEYKEQVKISLEKETEKKLLATIVVQW